MIHYVSGRMPRCLRYLDIEAAEFEGIAFTDFGVDARHFIGFALRADDRTTGCRLQRIVALSVVPMVMRHQDMS